MAGLIIIIIVLWILCLKYGLVDEWVLWVTAITFIIIIGVGVSK